MLCCTVDVNKMSCAGAGSSELKKVTGWLEVNGTKHELYSGENVVGSDESCSIVLKCKGIDKIHATITVDDPSFPMLCDKGSKYKTRLGKTILEPNRIYCFPDGAKIIFGNVKTTYLQNSSQDEDDDIFEEFIFTGESQQQIVDESSGNVPGNPAPDDSVNGSTLLCDKPAVEEKSLSHDAVDNILVYESPTKSPNVSGHVFVDTTPVKCDVIIEESFCKTDTSYGDNVEDKAASRSEKLQSSSVTNKETNLSGKNVGEASSAKTNVSLVNASLEESFEAVDNTSVSSFHFKCPSNALLSEQNTSEGDHKSNKGESCTINNGSSEEDVCETQRLDDSFEYVDKTATYVGVPTACSSFLNDTHLDDTAPFFADDTEPMIVEQMDECGSGDRTPNDSHATAQRGSDLSNTSIGDGVKCESTEKLCDSVNEVQNDSQLSFNLFMEVTESFEASSGGDNCSALLEEGKVENINDNKISKVDQCTENSIGHIPDTSQTNMEITLAAIPTPINAHYSANKTNLHSVSMDETNSQTQSQSSVSKDLHQTNTDTTVLNNGDTSQTTTAESLAVSSKVNENNVRKKLIHTNDKILKTAQTILPKIDELSDSDDDIKLIPSLLQVSNVEPNKRNSSSFEIEKLKNQKYETSKNNTLLEITKITKEDIKECQKTSIVSDSLKTRETSKYLKGAGTHNKSDDSDTDDGMLLSTQKIFIHDVKECQRIPIDMKVVSSPMDDNDSETDEDIHTSGLRKTSEIDKGLKDDGVLKNSDDSETDDDIDCLPTQKISIHDVKECQRIPIDKNTMELKDINYDLKADSSLKHDKDSETDENIDLLPTQKIYTENFKECQRMPIDNDNLESRETSKCLKKVSVHNETDDSDTDDDIDCLPTQKISIHDVKECQRIPIDKNTMELQDINYDLKADSSLKHDKDSETDENIDLLPTQKIYTENLKECQRMPIDNDNLESRETSKCFKKVSVHNETDDSDTDDDILLLTQNIPNDDVKECQQIPIDKNILELQGIVNKPLLMSDKVASSFKDNKYSKTDEGNKLLSTQKISSEDVVECQGKPISIGNVESQENSTCKTSNSLSEAENSETDEAMHLLPTQKISLPDVKECQRNPIDKDTLKSQNMSNGLKVASSPKDNNDSETDEDIQLLPTQKISCENVKICQRIPIDKDILKSQDISNGSKVGSSPKDNNDSETDEEIHLLPTQKISCEDVKECQRIPIDKDTLKSQNMSNGSKVASSPNDNNDSETDEDIQLLPTQKISCENVIECQRIPINIDNLESQETSICKISNSLSEAEDGETDEEDMHLLPTQKISIPDVKECERIPVDKDTLNSQNISNGIQVASSPTDDNDSETDEEIHMLPTQKISCENVKICQRIPIDKDILKSQDISNGSKVGSSPKDNDDSETDEDIQLLPTQKISCEDVMECQRIPISIDNLESQETSICKISNSLSKAEVGETDEEDMHLLPTQKISIPDVKECQRNPIYKDTLKSQNTSNGLKVACSPKDNVQSIEKLDKALKNTENDRRANGIDNDLLPTHNLTDDGVNLIKDVAAQDPGSTVKKFGLIRTEKCDSRAKDVHFDVLGLSEGVSVNECMKLCETENTESKNVSNTVNCSRVEQGDVSIVISTSFSLANLDYRNVDTSSEQNSNVNASGINGFNEADKNNSIGGTPCEIPNVVISPNINLSVLNIKAEAISSPCSQQLSQSLIVQKHSDDDFSDSMEIKCEDDIKEELCDLSGNSVSSLANNIAPCNVIESVGEAEQRPHSYEVVTCDKSTQIMERKPFNEETSCSNVKWVAPLRVVRKKTCSNHSSKTERGKRIESERLQTEYQNPHLCDSSSRPKRIRNPTQKIKDMAELVLGKKSAVNPKKRSATNGGKQNKCLPNTDERGEEEQSPSLQQDLLKSRDMMAANETLVVTSSSFRHETNVNLSIEKIDTVVIDKQDDVKKSTLTPPLDMAKITHRRKRNTTKTEHPETNQSVSLSNKNNDIEEITLQGASKRKQRNSSDSFLHSSDSEINSDKIVEEKTALVGKKKKSSKVSPTKSSNRGNNSKNRRPSGEDLLESEEKSDPTSSKSKCLIDLQAESPLVGTSKEDQINNSRIRTKRKNVLKIDDVMKKKNKRDVESADCDVLSLKVDDCKTFAKRETRYQNRSNRFVKGIGHSNKNDLVTLGNGLENKSNNINESLRNTRKRVKNLSPINTSTEEIATTLSSVSKVSPQLGNEKHSKTTMNVESDSIGVNEAARGKRTRSKVRVEGTPSRSLRTKTSGCEDIISPAKRRKLSPVVADGVVENKAPVCRGKLVKKPSSKSAVGETISLPINTKSNAELASPVRKSKLTCLNSTEMNTTAAGRRTRQRGKIEANTLRDPATNVEPGNANNVAPTNKSVGRRKKTAGGDSLTGSTLESSVCGQVTPTKTRGSTSCMQGTPYTVTRLRPKTVYQQQREQVIFTGVHEEKYSNIITKLGGEVMACPSECTVLVTDKVRRTVKFLCVVAMGKPIVSLQWVLDSNEAGCFLDPWEYLVCDKNAEAKFSFVLCRSLKAAQQKPLLEEYSIYVTPSVKPTPNELKSIIISSGGTFHSKVPAKWNEPCVIITCQEDKSMWAKLRKNKANVPLVNVEAILTGILQQLFVVEDFLLAV